MIPAVKMAKTNAPAPNRYLRRKRDSLTSDGKYSNWQNMSWGSLNPKDFLRAEQLVSMWNQVGGSWEYKLPLSCDRCYTSIVSETYPAIGLGAGLIGKHVCSKCHLEGLENMAPKKATGDLQQKYNPVKGKWELLPLQSPEGMTKPMLVRKEGDIWKLPRSSSPMWTNQWGYQGSSKVPYIISHNSQKLDGSATDDGWACSCPGFTRRTPRTPCKHILNVRLNEGIVTPKAKTQTQVANLDDKTAAEFEKWQREKAAAKSTPTAGDAKLNLFGSTGRKFR